MYEKLQFRLQSYPRPDWNQDIIILIHWGRVTHICVSTLAIIGSDIGLSPNRRQAIIWVNAGIIMIMLIGLVGTNSSEIWMEIYAFSCMKMHLKMSGNGGHFVSASMC